MNAQVRHKGQVTIPAAIRQEAQIEEGDCLHFTVRAKGEVLLRLVTTGNGNGASSPNAEVELPAEMVERIDRALAELDAGLVTRYESEEDFFASLDD